MENFSCHNLGMVSPHNSHHETCLRGQKVNGQSHKGHKVT